MLRVFLAALLALSLPEARGSSGVGNRAGGDNPSPPPTVQVTKTTFNPREINIAGKDQGTTLTVEVAVVSGGSSVSGQVTVQVNVISNPSGVELSHGSPDPATVTVSNQNPGEAKFTYSAKGNNTGTVKVQASADSSTMNTIPPSPMSNARSEVTVSK